MRLLRSRVLPSLRKVPLLAFLLIASCTSIPSSDNQTADSRAETPIEDFIDSKLYVSPDAYDFSENPALLERLLESPHTYFRFINQESTQAICALHRARGIAGIATVNLHGDAHLEQYLATVTNRGLTDFDAASTGPPMIDLVRFGVSVSLAAEMLGWSEQRRELLEEFVRGYRTAVEEPDTNAPVPAVVTRIRSGIRMDHAAFLAWAEQLMRDQDQIRKRIKIGGRLYLEQMRQIYPDLPDHFFEVKRGGRLRLGVGSALDRKFLLRVEGPTASPDDDLILEAKEIDLKRDFGCARRLGLRVGQILVAQSRIALRPDPYIGFVHFHPSRAQTREVDPEIWDGSLFWVHAWEDGYTELSVEESFQSYEELKEVVFDVGIQLGLGHPKGVMSPHDDHLRGILLWMIETYEDRYYEAVDIMTNSTIQAWIRFKTEVGND